MGNRIATKMTRERADEINQAIITILDVANGVADGSLYPIHETTLIRTNGLRDWLAATDFIDDWNKKEGRRAMLEGREPRFVRTADDRFIAGLFAFISFPEGHPIVWNGKKLALAVVQGGKKNEVLQ